MSAVPLQRRPNVVTQPRPWMVERLCQRHRLAPWSSYPSLEGVRVWVGEIAFEDVEPMLAYVLICRYLHKGYDVVVEGPSASWAHMTY